MVVAPLAALALFASACGTSETSSPSSSAGSSSESASAPASDVVAKAQAAVTAAMAPPSVPALKPVTLKPGPLKVGYLVCGEAAPACHAMGVAAKEAIEAAGYTPVILDGKLTPQGWNDAIMAMINQKVDVIVNMVASDALVKSAVEAAFAAKIPVVCQICQNSASPVKNGSSANVDPDMSFQGTAVANFMIATTDGKPQAALMTNKTAPPVTARMEAILKSFEGCASLGCKVVFSQELGQNGDLVANSRNLSNAILQQHAAGTLDFIVPPSDSQSQGLQQSLSTTGRDDVDIASFDCGDPNLQWIRDGEYQNVCVATPLIWSSWAAIDQAVRILAGEKGADILLPSQLITKDNVPAKGTPVEPTDFKSIYTAAWGK